VALHHLGRVTQAAEVGAELEPLARKLGHFAALSFCIWTESWTEFAEDPDFSRLEKRLAEDLEINRTAKILLLLAPVLAQFSVVEFLRGNVGKALDYAEQARELTPFQVMIGFGEGALFRQMAYAADRRGALKLFDQSRSKLPRSGEPNTVGSWAMLMSFVEGLHELGEYEMAAGLYPMVGELIDTGTICMGWIARFPQTVAGIAAAAARDWDAAEEHFAIALRQAEEFPHLVEVADIRRFRATMLIRRGAPGDFILARGLLDEALNSYTRFTMPRHAESVRSLVAGLLDRS
jgi:tetratricopeptide (TPR) repeat protein